MVINEITSSLQLAVSELVLDHAGWSGKMLPSAFLRPLLPCPLCQAVFHSSHLGPEFGAKVPGASSDPAPGFLCPAWPQGPPTCFLGEEDAFMQVRTPGPREGEGRAEPFPGWGGELCSDPPPSPPVRRTNTASSPKTRCSQEKNRVHVRAGHHLAPLKEQLGPEGPRGPAGGCGQGRWVPHPEACPPFHPRERV